ncbi:YhcN/YlaJ family sporulation lipoprotein [Rossellomorea vietnamensis]|uniref:YhcN/YlaJ family sporulation lipoprotein n=1 Tax=Rossellomorea vietnamensis TaxID=218284 RepID=A0A5D4MI27_9BACI|nr:YhcN/YlaJ family sporulation lipoprotein [Rossellomorea vietnamensis]TYS01490.1 YhcN/YlaJ family sporulation lipoprotein [Rossellomorea vietnamensis]
MKRLLCSMMLMTFLAGCALNNDENLGQEGEGGGMGVQQVRYNTTNSGGNNIYGEANPADPAYGKTDRMANKVMKFYEVERAYVYTKGKDAYTAIVLENRLAKSFDADLKEKIEQAVKSVDRNIENVFVTTDSELIKDMKKYRNQVHSGRPVEDLGERIEERAAGLFTNIQ